MPITWNNPELGVVPRLQPLTLEDMSAQGTKSTHMLTMVRDAMLSPTSEKKAPSFTVDQLAALCGITKQALAYRLTRRPDLPQGTLGSRGQGRRFALAEARTWVKALRPSPPRPPSQHALVIAVANTKGGVGKTTTSFVLAQGLSRRGYDVLLVDGDPQGSATTLCGTVPETDVDEADTIMPFLAGDQPDLRYAVRKTYWDGLDLIAANTQAYAAELYIPANAVKGRGKLWNQLAPGLAPIRSDVDVIIIDTAPALSYMTINALFAADGILIPVPPNALDYAAGAQFWSLFGDLATSLEGFDGSALKGKTWDFTYVLPTNVDPSSSAYPVVRDWMTRTYGEKIFPAEILKSKVAETLSAEFATVYDVTRYEGNAASFARLRDGYDRLCEMMDFTLLSIWQSRVNQGAKSNETAEALRPVQAEA